MHAMSETTAFSHEFIVTRIKAFIVEVSPVAGTIEITPETRLRADLALDSVASLELLSMIDEAFGLEIEIEEVAGIDTVGGIIALAEARVLAGGAGK